MTPDSSTIGGPEGDPPTDEQRRHEPREASAPKAPKRGPLARFAPLLLVAAAGIVAARVLPKMPRERSVRYELGDASSITRVDVVWTSAPEPSSAAAGAAWSFERGAAPRSLRSVMSLPDGHYALDAVIHRGEERQNVRRTIELGQSASVVITLARDP